MARVMKQYVGRLFFQQDEMEYNSKSQQQQQQQQKRST